MQYGNPAPFVALALALVSGVLLAVGHYVGGAITGFLAVVLLALWRWSVEHDDDDRHTLW